ncbi:hypothetical protein E2C01_003772 [Portunus trituberculatus]|uniref:Uncharacterized protein n=1 Tax=Portunus trituberculatus TaxID=210409 RepID=A0A5B7CN83_PORTR|nr:hypothetical protein [Portunus trituberculatus]
MKRVAGAVHALLQWISGGELLTYVHRGGRGTGRTPGTSLLQAAHLYPTPTCPPTPSHRAHCRSRVVPLPEVLLSLREGTWLAEGRGEARARGVWAKPRREGTPPPSPWVLSRYCPRVRQDDRHSRTLDRRSPQGTTITPMCRGDHCWPRPGPCRQLPQGVAGRSVGRRWRCEAPPHLERALPPWRGSITPQHARGTRRAACPVSTHATTTVAAGFRPARNTQELENTELLQWWPTPVAPPPCAAASVGERVPRPVPPLSQRLLSQAGCKLPPGPDPRLLLRLPSASAPTTTTDATHASCHHHHDHPLLLLPLSPPPLVPPVSLVTTTSWSRSATTAMISNTPSLSIPWADRHSTQPHGMTDT